ncbi:ATP-binding protein [Streptomyces sp. BE20]|uniref:ATP-binding protein n=1 Tax=Streptomyces sp. BE20 TaxID=3002525 RepID=UPI002E7695DD|nr:ATP-binding protein [Streptomyces sp. BE20]MEE1820978.1 ATP-binding protein [Streptomyces sp. BE20]
MSSISGSPAEALARAFPDGSGPGRLRDGTGLLLLAAEDRSVSTGRSFTREALRLWGLYERAGLEDVLLVVSELVTNAVRHRPGHVTDFEIRARIGHMPDVLAVGVEDPRPDRPVVKWPSRSAAGGRGLLLAEALRDEWPVLPTADDGKQVCAFWDLPPAAGLHSEQRHDGRLPASD